MLGRCLCNLFTMHHFFPRPHFWEEGREQKH